MDHDFPLAGFDVVVQIENDKWCHRVLKNNFESGIERCKSGNIRDVKVLPAGVKVILVTPPCVDLSAMNQFRVGIHGKETGKIREVFLNSGSDDEEGKTNHADLGDRERTRHTEQRSEDLFDSRVS